MIELDPAQWTKEEAAEFAAKGWRSRRAGPWTQRTQWDDKAQAYMPLAVPVDHVGEWPPVSAPVRPADYANDFHRGTVPYDRQWRNYSYHVVTVPEGTEILECNFTQADPKTLAIVPEIPGGKPLTLTGCNLCNVALTADHVVKESNTSQGWMVEITDPVTTEKTIDRVYLGAHPDEIIGTPVKPPNVVKPFDAAAIPVGAEVPLAVEVAPSRLARVWAAVREVFTR